MIQAGIVLREGHGVTQSVAPPLEVDQLALGPVVEGWQRSASPIKRATALDYLNTLPFTDLADPLLARLQGLVPRKAIDMQLPPFPPDPVENLDHAEHLLALRDLVVGEPPSDQRESRPERRRLG